MNLPHSSISNLLLLPRSFNIENHGQEINNILNSHHVFNRMYKLEQSIQLLLKAIEDNGLLISNEWFRSGLENERSQLRNVITKINQYLNRPDGIVEVKHLKQYWKEKQLPVANSFEALSNYKNLHPTYKLMLKYKKHCNYLNQWSKKLSDKGSWMDDGLLIKGKWSSFSSYSGRAFPKNLPLGSMPSAMRAFIVSPKGFQLVSLDLNNAELRFLAYYAKCKTLNLKFNAGEDIHHETAKLIQKSIDSYEVNEEQAREMAKRYTYSFLYGAGVWTITKNLQKVFKEVTSLDVVNINESFINQYPEIQTFLLERENSQSLLTPFGEVEPIATFRKTQRRNFTLQSSVSVAIKMLMTILFKHEIQIVHVLHDEVWILSPEEDVNFENLISKTLKEYEEKIQSIFPGIPIKGLLKEAIIGGKNNE